MVSFQQINYILFTSEVYEELPKENGKLCEQRLVRKDQFLVSSDVSDADVFQYVYHWFEGRSAGIYDFVITPTTKVSKEFYETYHWLHLENLIDVIFRHHHE